MMRARVLISVALGALTLTAVARADGAYLEPALRYADDLTVTHRYREAEALLDSLDEVTDGKPELHFRKLALYYTWLDDYGIADSLEAPFRAAVDSTIRTANAVIEDDPDNAIAHYFRGMGYTYRSLYDSYVRGISVSTVRSLYDDATAGVDDLIHAYELDNSLNDALLGVGKYHHWKAMRLPWPFGREGDRKKGLRQMQQAINGGLRWEAGGVQTLGGVYMGEGRYEDAIALVTPMYQRYPGSRFFSVVLARAYMELGRFDEAQEMLDHVFENLSPRERSSRFIMLKVRRYVAKLRMYQGRHEEACSMARDLLDTEYPGVHSDWLRRKFSVVKKIRKRSCGE